MSKRVLGISLSTILVFGLFALCILQYWPMALYAILIAMRPPTTPLPDIDLLFSQNRGVIAIDAKEADLYPATVANFILSTKPIADGWYIYKAPGGGVVQIRARKTPTPSPSTYLQQDRIGCGDYTLPIISHLDAKFPYTFHHCGGYVFEWVNGDWIIHVSSLLEPNQFLQYVNNYPY